MDTDKMLARLEALARRRVALEAEIDGLVGMLMASDLEDQDGHRRSVYDVSWADVGDALGITRQAAHQLYRRRWSQ